MKLFQYDYRREKLIGDELAIGTLVQLLTGKDSVRIVYDTEGFLGHDKNFGINYGGAGKKGFSHEHKEYVISTKPKSIHVSQPYQVIANLFYDADKRDSFATYKVTELGSIDDVLTLFDKMGFQVIN